MDANKRLLDFDFVTLNKYYPNIYETLKKLLDSFQEAFHSHNGGFYVENVHSYRQHLWNDPVFGEGRGWLRAELLPRVVGDLPKKVVQTRVRRRRFPKEEGLPEAPFPLVSEMNVGYGWMAWVNGCFYMQDGPVWKPLPFYDGEFRPVGWLIGDDLPQREHDYVDIVHELPPAPPLLPPMFA